MATENVTVREFLNDYLIKQIGNIKDNQPYFAFALMAIGIEFLGKCQNNHLDWNFYKKKQPEIDFKAGMKLPPLKKYKHLNLYDRLRCGLAHSLSTKGNLSLSNKGSKKTINCEDFYNDFVAACNEVLSGKVVMPQKTLDDTFFVVTRTDGGTSITGNSSSLITQTQN